MNYSEIKAVAITLTRKLELEPFMFIDDDDSMKNKKLWEYLEPLAIKMIQRSESKRTYSVEKYLIEIH